MPNAATHDVITLVTGTAAVAAYYNFVPHPVWSYAAIFAGTYLFAGFACAGDLDLDSKEYRRWGPLRFLWWPYQKLVPHRSWISHGLILGGVIRIAYLVVILTLIAAGGFWAYGWFHGIDSARSLALQQWASLGGFVETHPAEVGMGLTGFILAGTVHALSDSINTWFKRKF